MAADATEHRLPLTEMAERFPQLFSLGCRGFKFRDKPLPGVPLPLKPDPAAFQTTNNTPMFPTLAMWDNLDC